MPHLHPRGSLTAEQIMIEREEALERSNWTRDHLRLIERHQSGVYFITSRCLSFTKIGWVKVAGAVDLRLNELQIGCPHDLFCEFIVSPCTRAGERNLHRHFRAMALRGEWFRRKGSLKSALELSRSMPVLASSILLVAADGRDS